MVLLKSNKTNNRLLSKLYYAGDLLRRYNARIIMYLCVHCGSARRSSLPITLHSEFRKKSNGFTLIEVLLALAVLAIAVTALLNATSLTIKGSNSIQEKSIKHWVAMQIITQIQMHTINLKTGILSTGTLHSFTKNWYYQASLTPTNINQHLQKITVTISDSQHGPFDSQTVAFFYS